MVFLKLKASTAWQMSPACHFDLEPFHLDLHDFETQASYLQKSSTFGPWSNTACSNTRGWAKTPKRGKKNSRRGKRRHSSRKVHPRRRMSVKIDTRSVVSYPSTYLQEYKRQKQEQVKKLSKKKENGTAHAKLNLDKKASLSLTDVKLCEYQEHTRLGKNLPSLSQTILKYDAANHAYAEQIPNGLQPRAQLKQPKKCRKLSVPYADHLTQHITELKAHSVCTIIEPRDPKSFRLQMNNASNCGVPEQSVTPHKLELSLAEQCRQHQSPTRSNNSTDSIKSYTIDQQKEKLADYLAGGEEKRQVSKTSFLCPKREKTLARCGSVAKKLGETAVGSTKSPPPPTKQLSSPAPTSPRLDHECVPNGGGDAASNRSYKSEYRNSRHSTFMWQQPLSYDIGSNNKIHLPDIQAVVKLTEKAMKEAFMTPFNDHLHPPPAKEKSPLPAAPTMPVHVNYQRLVELCKNKSSYQDFNLAKELSKLSNKTNKLNWGMKSSGCSGAVAPPKPNCIYCQLVLRRLDLYQSPQFGVTSERMLIYKRMQRQTN